MAVTLTGGLVVVPFLRNAYARRFMLRPPSALDEKRFIGACVKCGKCAQACPYKAIKLAGPEAGLAIGTPQIIAREEPCQLCTDLPCIKACPSGALDKGVDHGNLKQIHSASVDLPGNGPNRATDL